MNYRSLLVHVDAAERSAARVDIAARLAVQLDAHLVGLAPTGALELPMEFGPGMVGLDVLTEALASLRGKAEGVAARFREQCGLRGAKSFESVIHEAEGGSSVLAHSLRSDLVVIGQADPSLPGAGAARRFVEEVVLYNPRPTLIVPYAGQWPTLGETVLVAWTETRESARAVADAMPLLSRAKEVHVLQCFRPDDGVEREARDNLDALHRWLLWHGVEARLHTEATTIGFGDAILSRAADLDADLLVMGGYGHARWAEQVLGGVTRDVLREMTLPVLMSH
jgi:nucleotide-binding universal stress UspA family protein